MFSVIIYGRNDSHGYNLHKRAAISFNALAEVMSDPDDEILFVDYNTPDDHPTFPEAIHDTLTEKAKKVMRVLRVRPEQHVAPEVEDPPGRARVAIAQRCAAALKSAQSLDPLHQYRHAAGVAHRGRVAERHSGRRSRWLLPDPALRDSRDAVGGGVRPADPAGNLAKLRDWSVRFHLNQVVHNFMPMKYDALGDFQAVLREDMFADPRLRRDDDPGLALRFQPGGAARALPRQGRYADRQGVRLSLRPHARRGGQQQGPRDDR